MDPERLPELRESHLRASHADREQVAELLREAAGDGRLDVGELEERLEQTYAAKTYGELEPVLRDLPVAGAPQPPAVPGPKRLERWAAAAPSVQGVTGAQRVGGVPSGSEALAIFGAAERKGSWVVPSKFTATAIFGGVDLDLREARFETPRVEIQAVAVFGGVDVIVPPDVVVEVEGMGIMGGFGRPRESSALPADAPVVRVTGLALFGGVDVKVKPLKAPKQPKLPRSSRSQGQLGPGT